MIPECLGSNMCSMETWIVTSVSGSHDGANTVWPGPITRTVRRCESVFFLFFFSFLYTENAVQAPSDLPRLKAHGVHWATDVSILKMRAKRRKATLVDYCGTFNLGWVLWDPADEIYSLAAAKLQPGTVWHLKLLWVSFHHQLIQGRNFPRRIQMWLVTESWIISWGKLLLESHHKIEGTIFGREVKTS